MAGTRIEKLRQIVDRHQAAEVDGYMVDALTASMLVAVYDATTKQKHRDVFEAVEFGRLVEFGWKHVKAAS